MAAKKKASEKVRKKKSPAKKKAKAPANKGASHPRFVSGQFKPGQSGNPAGRPKRKPLDEVVLEMLDQEVTADGRTRTDQLAVILLDEILNKRNGRMLKEVLSRLWPVKQIISGDPDNPVIPRSAESEERDLSVLSDAELRVMDKLEKKILDGRTRDK